MKITKLRSSWEAGMMLHSSGQNVGDMSSPRGPRGSDISRQPGSFSTKSVGSREKKSMNSMSTIPQGRSAQAVSSSDQDRWELGENDSLSLDPNKQILEEYARSNEKCQDLQARIDAKNLEIEEISTRLAQERSRMEMWTKQAQNREEDWKRQIETFKAQKEEIYARLLKGPKVFASSNELEESLNTWYSAAVTFCPKYFPYTEISSDKRTPLLPGEFEQYAKPDERGEDSLFYYERQSRLFESIITRASVNFLESAHQRLGVRLAALQQVTWEQQLNIATSLPFYTNLVSHLLHDESVQLTTYQLASALHRPDADVLIMAGPDHLRQSVEAIKKLVQRDMAEIRDQGEGIGRNDFQVKKQLDSLITSLIGVLLNTEAGGICYRFIRIDTEETFDSERMEAVGRWTGVEDGFSEDLSVRLAMTRALMECDEIGAPQRCIAKAKVVLKLGSVYAGGKTVYKEVE